MLKQTIKSMLSFLHLDLTKNLKYDRLTAKIIKQVVKKESVCIDIGCHLGEILDKIIKSAPHSNNFAFEPLPNFYNHIKQNFKVNLYPYALSKSAGNIEFNYVENSPEYSGIKKRDYFGIKEPKVTMINVVMETLDNVIPENVKIDFIKIDVEGAEYDVLIGAKQTILKSKPTIIFEFGIGASNHYGVNPKDMYELLVDQYGMKLYTLQEYLKSKNPFDKNGFVESYNKKKDYYFIASY
jgi:FkbM family methyltransferase